MKEIEFLNELQDNFTEFQEEYYNKMILKIIELLEKGEENKKYKAMWRKLENIVRSGDIFTLLPDDMENKGLHITAILKAFLSIEQKYFPKPIKKTIILEIEATSEENLESKIESLRKIFEVHNEFNWGKTKILEIKGGN